MMAHALTSILLWLGIGSDTNTRIYWMVSSDQGPFPHNSFFFSFIHLRQRLTPAKPAPSPSWLVPPKLFQELAWRQSHRWAEPLPRAPSQGVDFSEQTCSIKNWRFHMCCLLPRGAINTTVAAEVGPRSQGNKKSFYNSCLLAENSMIISIVVCVWLMKLCIFMLIF